MRSLTDKNKVPSPVDLGSGSKFLIRKVLLNRGARGRLAEDTLHRNPPTFNMFKGVSDLNFFFLACNLKMTPFK